MLRKFSNLNGNIRSLSFMLIISYSYFFIPVTKNSYCFFPYPWCFLPDIEVHLSVLLMF